MKNAFSTIKKQAVPLLLIFAATACNNTRPEEDQRECPGKSSNASYFVYPS